MAKGKSVYTNIIGRSELPFQIFIGERGVGKTYSAIRHCLVNHIPFIYLRRTDTEMRMLSTEYSNPCKSIAKNEGLDIRVEMSKDFASIQECVTTYEDGDEIETYYPRGFICALSTFSKLRGVDFNEIEVIIFDEFIPESHVRPIRNESDAFLHLYETVNRNREFDGKPPLRVYLLGNAISLRNTILLGLGVVTKIADMKAKGQSRFSDKKRGIYVELIDNPEFQAVKGTTALYNLTAGTSFSEQALNNNFTQDDMSQIKPSMPVNEYIPEFGIANNFILYRHKSNGTLYCKKVRAVPVGIINYREADKDVCYWRYAPTYRLANLRRMIYYDDYSTKLFFDNIMSR